MSQPLHEGWIKRFNDEFHDNVIFQGDSSPLTGLVMTDVQIKSFISSEINKAKRGMITDIIDHVDEETRGDLLSYKFINDMYSSLQDTK